MGEMPTMGNLEVAGFESVGIWDDGTIRPVWVRPGAVGINPVVRALVVHTPERYWSARTVVATLINVVGAVVMAVHLAGRGWWDLGGGVSVGASLVMFVAGLGLVGCLLGLRAKSRRIYRDRVAGAYALGVIIDPEQMDEYQVIADQVVRARRRADALDDDGQGEQAAEMRFQINNAVTRIFGAYAAQRSAGSLARSRRWWLEYREARAVLDQQAELGHHTAR